MSEARTVTDITAQLNGLKSAYGVAVPAFDFGGNTDTGFKSKFEAIFPNHGLGDKLKDTCEGTFSTSPGMPMLGKLKCDTSAFKEKPVNAVDVSGIEFQYSGSEGIIKIFNPDQYCVRTTEALVKDTKTELSKKGMKFQDNKQGEFKTALDSDEMPPLKMQNMIECATTHKEGTPPPEAKVPTTTGDKTALLYKHTDIKASEATYVPHFHQDTPNTPFLLCVEKAVSAANRLKQEAKDSNVDVKANATDNGVEVQCKNGKTLMIENNPATVTDGKYPISESYYKHWDEFKLACEDTATSASVRLIKEATTAGATMADYKIEVNASGDNVEISCNNQKTLKKNGTPTTAAKETLPKAEFVKSWTDLKFECEEKTKTSTKFASDLSTAAGSDFELKADGDDKINVSCKDDKKVLKKDKADATGDKAVIQKADFGKAWDSHKFTCEAKPEDGTDSSSGAKAGAYLIVSALAGALWAFM